MPSAQPFPNSSSMVRPVKSSHCLLKKLHNVLSQPVIQKSDPCAHVRISVRIPHQRIKIISIMHTLKITTVGNSLALTIPKELVNRFHLQKGDEIFVRETPEGFEVSPYDPDFKEAMETAASIAKEYKNALRILAQK
jgi:putative addiction module antidote